MKLHVFYYSDNLLVNHVDVGGGVVFKLQDVHHVHDLTPSFLLLDQRRILQVDRQFGLTDRIPTQLKTVWSLVTSSLCKS